MEAILVLVVVVVSLELVHREILVVLGTFVLFATTNTKVVLVLDVVPKCKEPTFK
jgi:hypothetical protein